MADPYRTAPDPPALLELGDFAACPCTPDEAARFAHIVDGALARHPHVVVDLDGCLAMSTTFLVTLGRLLRDKHGDAARSRLTFIAPCRPNRLRQGHWQERVWYG